MPKSNRARVFGRGSGAVTVIEQPVQRSFIRRAKIVFWVVLVAVTAVAATILGSMWEARFGHIGAAIAAVFAGALIGLAVAFLVACVVAAWPVLRVIWWWLPELVMASAAGVAWVELVTYTGLIVRLAVLAAVIGVPAAIAPVRRALSAYTWCLISRHRLRTCFSEFIIANRTGSLPLILGAVPTPAGERIWAFLRPGLSLKIIQEDTEKIAVACWASSAIADAASPSNAALVRIDIKRRDPLTGTIASPLAALAGTIKSARQADAPAPVAVDLTDVTAEDVTPAKGKNASVASVKRPRWPDAPATAGGPLTGKVIPPEEDDLADWLP